MTTLDDGAGRLGPAERESALAAMTAGTFDVVVVGGGVVGAGAALDAATRGLSVALVEARDWAGGTSSRSSKLIHGGLRYLEMLDFGLVAEALRERGLIVTQLAPHLARPVPFLYPLKHRVWERPYVAAGVTLYAARYGLLPYTVPEGKEQDKAYKKLMERVYKQRKRLSMAYEIAPPPKPMSIEVMAKVLLTPYPEARPFPRDVI